jgi:hypothetical protein
MRRRSRSSKPRATAWREFATAWGATTNIATASVLAVLSASRRLGVSAKDLKLAG